MAISDLFDTYASGGITRGAFIRRLGAFGISAAVAAAYANTLGAEAARASTTALDGTEGCQGDLYGSLYGDLYGSLYGDLYGSLYCD